MVNEQKGVGGHSKGCIGDGQGRLRQLHMCFAGCLVLISLPCTVCPFIALHLHVVQASSSCHVSCPCPPSQGISGITAPVERQLPLSHAGPRSPHSPTVLHGPEQYTSSCLFAIIGPSGAGKTVRWS